MQQNGDFWTEKILHTSSGVDTRAGEVDGPLGPPFWEFRT